MGVWPERNQREAMYFAFWHDRWSSGQSALSTEPRDLPHAQHMVGNVAIRRSTRVGAASVALCAGCHSLHAPVFCEDFNIQPAEQWWICYLP